MRHVIIHGLRRSGTTILWETLRSDETLRCYDEPFHPRLADGARENHKGTWTELKALLQGEGLTPAAIQPVGELESDSAPDEIAWLGKLCASQSPVVIDIVRGWNRAPTIHEACGDVLSVHLIRDPVSWVAAHLVPSGVATFRRRVAGLYRRKSFFIRRGFYDNYQYQTIIEAALAMEHPVFEHVRSSGQSLSNAPAYVKLLAFWWGANCTLAQRLQEADVPRLSVTLGAFCNQPEYEIDRIAKAADWPHLHASTGAVRRVAPGFHSSAIHWLKAARELGLPEALFDPEQQTAESMSRAFETGSVR